MLIRTCQEQVAEFHRVMNCTIGDPDAPKIIDHTLRVRLIQEETTETGDALNAGSILDVIDGLCDVLYVTLGAAVTFGISLGGGIRAPRTVGAPPSLEALRFVRPRFATESFLTTQAIAKGDDPIEVAHRLGRLVRAIRNCAEAMPINLEPFWSEVHRKNMAKASGPVREDGKRLKPAGWTPPDHALIFERLYGEVPPSGNFSRHI